MEPKDAVEGMIAAQMVSLHNQMMHLNSDEERPLSLAWRLIDWSKNRRGEREMRQASSWGIEFNGFLRR